MPFKPKNYPTPSQLASPSFFPNVLQQQCRQISWQQVAALIAADASLKALTERIRLQQEDYKAYSQAKKALPAICPAAHCEGGHKAEHIVELTGCIMVDFDHVPQQRMEEVLSLLKGWDHTLMAYVTASGCGIHAMVRYTADTPEVAYRDAWQQVNDMASVLCGLPHDPATKDPCRLSFLAHDPQCFFNPAATPLLVVSTPAKGTGNPLAAHGHDAVATAYTLMERSGMVYTEGSRHHYLVGLCFWMLKMGVSEMECAAELMRRHPDHYEPIDKLVGSIYGSYGHLAGTFDWGSGNREPRPAPSPRAKGGELLSTMVRDFLAESGKVRYNVCKHQVEMLRPDGRWECMSDSLENTLWQEVCQAMGRDVSDRMVHNLINSECIACHNPIGAYLDSVRGIHTEGAIERLASLVTIKGGDRRMCDLYRDIYGLEERQASLFDEVLPQAIPPSITLQQFFVYCFRKWFVGIFAGLTNRKVVNHSVMMLMGRQGIGKSTFFNSLLPAELDDFYLECSSSMQMTKDSEIAATEFMLINLDEFDALGDRQLNQWKSLITKTQVRERAAYARNRTNLPHIASYCATGNSKQFLTDLTGNRRWLAFEAEHIELEPLHSLDHKALFAEALALMEGGFRYWMDSDDQRLLEVAQHEFMVPCVEMEMLREHFEPATPQHLGNWHTFTYIYTRLLAFLPNDRLDRKRLQQCLEKMQFDKKHTSKGSCYHVIEKVV